MTDDQRRFLEMVAAANTQTTANAIRAALAEVDRLRALVAKLAPSLEEILPTSTFDGDETVPIQPWYDMCDRAKAALERVKLDADAACDISADTREQLETAAAELEIDTEMMSDTDIVRAIVNRAKAEPTLPTAIVPEALILVSQPEGMEDCSMDVHEFEDLDDAIDWMPDDDRPGIPEVILVKSKHWHPVSTPEHPSAPMP